MVKLYELLQSIQILEAWNEKDININGIKYNSKTVTPGNIFVCIKGFKTDGHAYILDAVENGAVALIVEDFQEGWDIPQFRVECGRQALSALSDQFYGNPSEGMKIIGITGTNGKTTTSFMSNAILESHGLKTGLVGSVMVKIDDFSEPSKLTTPESMDLQHYIARMRDKKVTHLTMEVSSSALELHRVKNVDFDIVTFNNISREHIDLHGSFEKYFNSKASLIRMAGPDKWAILNIDCPYSASLVKDTRAKLITFGIENSNGHLWCRNLDLSTGRAKFIVEIRKPFRVGKIEYKPSQFDIELLTPGYHSVYNSMVAIIVGLLCGVPIHTIQESLKTFIGVERRFEIIFEDDFIIIDDHFANSGNIDVTLGTLERMDYKKLKLVYAIRGSRGPIVNRENAETIVKWASRIGISEIIVTKSQSHVTDKDKVTDKELEVFQKVIYAAGIKIHLYEELNEAIAHALSHAERGDIVLLAGTQGMDYGANIALEQLREARPNMDEERLFEALGNRVVGII